MTFQAHLAYPYVLANIVAKISGADLSLAESAIIIASSVLPDFDMAVVWLLKKKSSPLRHHAWITHTPFCYMVASALIAVFSFKIGILFFLATFLHFVMDMFYTGDGIRWLRPFSDKEFFIDNPTRGKHGTEWLKAYKKLPIWRIDLVFFAIAIIAFWSEYVAK